MAHYILVFRTFYIFYIHTCAQREKEKERDINVREDNDILNDLEITSEIHTQNCLVQFVDDFYPIASKTDIFPLLSVSLTYHCREFSPVSFLIACPRYRFSHEREGRVTEKGRKEGRSARGKRGGREGTEGRRKSYHGRAVQENR